MKNLLLKREIIQKFYFTLVGNGKVYQPLVDSSQFMHGDFAAGCIVEIEANLNKVGEIERCNPAVKDPCRNGKDQLEAGIISSKQ